MRSFKFDLMSCASRLKIPIAVRSFGPWDLLLRKLGEQRDVLGEGEVDLVERRLELVEIEVLELQGTRQNDAVVVDSVARVDEPFRVQLEELLEELGRRVLGDIADVDPNDDERRVHPEGDGGVLVPGADEKGA